MKLTEILTGDNGQLFGWTRLTWELLGQLSTFLGLVMLGVSFIGVLWAVFYRERIRLWLQRYRFPVAGGEDDGTSWDALLFTISHAELPCWVMEQKRPKTIALLATADSVDNAHAVAATAKRLGLNTLQAKLLSDADDPAEARDAAAWLIRRLREQGAERIAVDVTGGKTPMSLGAFMAAQEQNCDTLYVASRYNQKLSKPDTATAQIRCITRAQ